MIRIVATLALILWPPLARAEAEWVDLELVLMVDVSRSMTERELEIQRRGYAEALGSDPVWAAVQTGLSQRIALSYVEWAGTQTVVVDWRLIETREDLHAFADALSVRFDPALRRTSISEALVFGTRMILDNGFQGPRRVIDISGDGPNNQGRPVERGREIALAEGITINGLPLMTREGIGMQWHLDDLDVYYRTCVIGGPGAFVIPVHDWDDFADAVRRKLILEIAAAPVPRVIRAQATRDPSDCLVGEKIWRDFRRSWPGDMIP